MGSLLASLMQFSSTSSTTLVLLNTGRGWSLLPQGIILTLLGLFWLATKGPSMSFSNKFIHQIYQLDLPILFMLRMFYRLNLTILILVTQFLVDSYQSQLSSLFTFLKQMRILYCFLRNSTLPQKRSGR